MRSLAWLLALSVAASACISSTVITSHPPGANVYLNGVPSGTTPVAMEDTHISGTMTRLRLELPGYEPFETVITRNEEIDGGALVGGIVLLVPFLWLLRYKPLHEYDLVPSVTGAR
jgi:hypothetical protein